MSCVRKDAVQNCMLLFPFFHGRKFTRQQYFDSSGLFISIVFSVPILMNCLVIVVSEFPVALVSLESHARGHAFIKNTLVTKALVSSSSSSVLCPTSALGSRLALLQFNRMLGYFCVSVIHRILTSDMDYRSLNVHKCDLLWSNVIMWCIGWGEGGGGGVGGYLWKNV